MTSELLAPAPSGVDADAWLAACRAVRSYCGWHVAPSVDETLTLDGSGARRVYLPSLHVTDVTAATSDGAAVTSPEWSESGIVKHPSGCWSSKMRGVTVTLAHGYDECPEDLLAVLRELVSSASLGGVSQVTNGEHSVRFEGALNTRQRSVLDAYRIVSVA